MSEKEVHLICEIWLWSRVDKHMNVDLRGGKNENEILTSTFFSLSKPILIFRIIYSCNICLIIVFLCPK